MALPLPESEMQAGLLEMPPEPPVQFRVAEQPAEEIEAPALSPSMPTMKRAKHRGENVTPENAAGLLVKRLEKLTATGFGIRDLFEDFMKLANITLDALPAHWECLKRGEEPTDPPEIKKRFDAVMQRYARDGEPSQYVYQLFGEMFAILLEASDDGGGTPSFKDALGEVYMEAISHGNNGEFYTPQHLTRAMARMNNPTEMLREHLIEAGAQTQQGKIMSALGVDVRTWQTDSLIAWYMADAELRGHYEPVTVNDPACGSGVMLLSMAAEVPPVALQLRLIEFSGTDISHTAVEMCKLNMRLYGLNGAGYSFQVEPPKEGA